MRDHHLTGRYFVVIEFLLLCQPALSEPDRRAYPSEAGQAVTSVAIDWAGQVHGHPLIALSVDDE